MEKGHEILSLDKYSKKDRVVIGQVNRFFMIYLMNMNPPETIRNYFDKVFTEIGKESEKK